MIRATSAQRATAFADQVEPRLRRAYVDALSRLQDGPTLSRLTSLMDSGDVNGVVRLVFDSPEGRAALRQVEVAYASALQQGVASRLAVVVTPTISPVLVEAARRFEHGAFRRVVDGARDGLRTQVANALERGQAPAQIARGLKSTVGSVGLTAYDERIIDSFRKALEDGKPAEALARELRDRRYDRALAKPLTPRQIDAMVTAYRRKLIAFRADSFARTTSIQAANEASRASWEEAVSSGAAQIEQIRRYWVVAHDERLCPICAAIPGLNPRGVGLREAFNTPSGPFMTPAVHPNCRCTVSHRVEDPRVRQRPAPGTRRFVFPT